MDSEMRTAAGFWVNHFVMEFWTSIEAGARFETLPTGLPTKKGHKPSKVQWSVPWRKPGVSFGMFADSKGSGGRWSFKVFLCAHGCSQYQHPPTGRWLRVGKGLKRSQLVTCRRVLVDCLQVFVRIQFFAKSIWKPFQQGTGNATDQ